MEMRPRIWAAALLTMAVVLMLGAFCLVRFVIFGDPVDKSGWSVEEGAVRYLDAKGEPVLGWQEIDGSSYYFLPGTGVMATGWQDVEGERYYFHRTGVRLTGWQSVEADRYYLNEKGVVLTGWQEIDGTRYCFSEEGKLLTGWKKVEGKLYYFTGEGKTLSGWQTLEEQLYYFTEAGHTLEGWHEVEGFRSCFLSDGSPAAGWYEDETGKYFFTEKGQPLVGLQLVEGEMYHFSESGNMTVGWCAIDSDRYYFHEDGTMAVGQVEIDGVTNFFTSQGKYVLLVNHNVSVPEDYALDLVDLGSHKVDRNTKEPLEKLINACKEAGYSCTINNIYRSKETQQYLWNRSVNNYMARGMSYEKACAETAKDTMIPGNSEHQTGLAVDLNGSSACYEWLAENCWDYGFILRYPSGKTEYTGIIHEPWHFRYVGEELAQELKATGLCMEEYMQMLTEANS